MPPQKVSQSTSGAGPILALIASARAISRADLVERSGLARATVLQRLSMLFAAGLVQESEETFPSGGRPSRVLQLNRNIGVLFVADVGETHIRLAATDLEPKILAEESFEFDIRLGPTNCLPKIAQQFEKLLTKISRHKDEVVGICLGMPAPVDFGRGRVVGPSVMTGWDNFDIVSVLNEYFQVPIYVENDVNLLTIAEVNAHWRSVGQLVFVKAGTGIGSGIITDSHLYRGSSGAAGDIGHIQFAGDSSPLCRCGKLGCVEARAAGWAIARDLQAKGFTAKNARDVIALVQANQPEAIQLVRQAGRVLGEVIADVVSVLNPSVIIIGGSMSEAGEHLLSGVREFVYQRSLPLATRELKIVVARHDRHNGLLGAAHLVLEMQLAPARIEETIERFQSTKFSKRRS